MKSVFAAIAFLAICCFSVHAADAGPEAEMKSQLAAMTAAFNKSDSKAIAEFFAPDATLINPQGVKSNGRAKIADQLQSDFGGIMKAGKSELKFSGMRVLGPDLAFVDSIQEITIKMPSSAAIPPMRIQFSGLAKKIGGKWLWLDVRPYSMMPSMAGGPPPPMPHGLPPGMKGMGIGKLPPAGGPPGPPPGGFPPGVANPPPPPPAAGQVPKTKGN